MSVTDPEQVISEIKRVLKPGGTFIFTEHVAAPRGTFTRKLQRILKKPCGILGQGCNPERDLGALINKAGFKEVQTEEKSLPIVRVVSPHIFGRAIK